MNDWEFSRCLIGEGNAWVRYDKPHRYGDTHTRLRYIVADAFNVLAKQKRAEGRPDRAGVCLHIERQLTAGMPVSKRVAQKAAKEIAAVRVILVDGVRISDHDR